jgi:hypothetical protein
MHGNIDYQPQDGGGTVFFFELPIAPASPIEPDLPVKSLSNQGYDHQGYEHG